MKNLVILLSPLILMFAVNGYAAEKNKSVNAHQEFNLKVVYGDKVSEFTVSGSHGSATTNPANRNKSGTLKFSFGGEVKERNLQEKDLKFLFAEIGKVKGSNQKHLCDDRGYIEVVNGQTKSIGCLGSTTKVAKQLTSMANLLSALVK